MNSESSTDQRLIDALTALQSARAVSASPLDRASAELLAAIAEEIIALRQEMTRSAGGLGLLSSSDEPASVQEQLTLLRYTCEAQREELRQLRELLQPDTRRPHRLAQSTPDLTPPREIRSMEYWEQNVPDYGDGVTHGERAAHLEKPRVRPEDVQLTAEDWERIRNVKRRSPGWREEDQSQFMWFATLGLVALALIFWIAMRLAGSF